MGHRFINRSQWFLAQQREPDYQYKLWNSSRILNSSRAHDKERTKVTEPLSGHRWVVWWHEKWRPVVPRGLRDILYVSLSEGTRVSLTDCSLALTFSTKYRWIRQTQERTGENPGWLSVPAPRSTHPRNLGSVSVRERQVGHFIGSEFAVGVLEAGLRKW